jgi:hypothetical protein
MREGVSSNENHLISYTCVCGLFIWVSLFPCLDDDSIGYYVQPTIVVTTHPHFKTIAEEIFGPVLTIYVYPRQEYESTVSDNVFEPSSFPVR